MRTYLSYCRRSDPIRERAVEQFVRQRRVVERANRKAQFRSRSNWPFRVGIIGPLRFCSFHET